MPSTQSKFKVAMLPKEDMDAAVRAENNSQLAIFGKIDYRTRTLTLVYGDFSAHETALNVFTPSGTRGTDSWCEPDFNDFEIIDCGLAVRFGKYEAVVTNL